MEVKYPLNLNEPVNDRIVRLLQLGESRDFVFADIASHCESSLDSKKQLQDLADVIAQIDLMNVFATGTVPKSAGDLPST
jgi:hypothetical protein